MIEFKSITYFRERMAALLKVKRGVYASAPDEIRREFTGKPIDQIRINNDMVLMDNELVVIKLRLPDKKHRLAKKDGYRLIYLVSKVNSVVAFLDIYPKNGPMQQIDEDDKELSRLVCEFVTEADAGVLEDYVI